MIPKTKKIIAILCALMLLAAHAPDVRAITISEEVELSREFLKMVRDHFKIIQDPVLNNYISTIGNKILSLQPHLPFEYHFYLIKSDVYNAFAAPAGHIFINSGLLAAMDSEDALAGILAHEIAHVTCRHISQKIERATKISLLTLAGIVAGIFLGAAGAGAAANAMTVGSMAAGQSLSLAYSREDERQADGIGLQYLKDAGYSARGLLKILREIRSKSWFGPSEIPTYLTTHPATDERITRIQAWVEDEEKDGAGYPRTPFSFNMAHARLLALHHDAESTLKRFSERLSAHPQDPALRYGYGLALAETGRRDAAVEQMKMALEKRAFDPAILAELGRIYFENGQYPEALSTLEGALSIAPEFPDALFYFGRACLETGRFAEAEAALDKLLKLAPEYPETRFFLSEAYVRLNRQSEAHYQLGLYYKDKGDTRAAAFHLRRVLEATEDAGEKEKIEAALKDVKADARKAEREEDRDFRR